MKMTLKKSAIVAAGLLLCNGVEAANADKYQITLESTEVITYESPENLKNNDGQVPVAFSLNVPKKALKPSEARTYKPVLVNGTWRQELPPIIVKGRTYDIVKREEFMFREESADQTKYYGAYVKPAFDDLDLLYNVDVDFHPSMRGAQLQVECEELSIARGKGAKGDFSSYDELNHGVKDYTNLYKFEQPTYIYGDETMSDGFGSASIFKVGSTVVDSEAFDCEFSKFVKRIKELENRDGHVQKMHVEVAASFEGSLKLNSELAEGRESSIREVVSKAFPEYEGLITYSHQDENWSDFIAAVSKEPYADKVMEIINNESDLDRRESKLLSTQYRKSIMDLCGKLRNCKIDVEYLAPKCSGKEGEYAATMQGAGSRGEVKSSSDIYTQNVNMLDYMDAGEYNKAFQVYQSMAKEEITPSIANNIGVLLTFLGDYPMAKYYFDQAECVASHDYNLGSMYLHAGEFKAAADAFGDKCSTNAVIANLAAERYAKAAELACDREYECAEMLYLRALAYSYTQSEELTLSTLAQACEKDSEYKALAKNQAEFITLRNLDTFKKIVK